MDAILDRGDAELANVAVKVPSGRIAEFYAAYGRWLAQPATKLAQPATEPEREWPSGHDRLPQPVRRPHGTDRGRWAWVVDRAWRVATPYEQSTRLCRFQTPRERCTGQPEAVSTHAHRYPRLYCADHVRHYRHCVADGLVWHWIWREDR
jgi:hypothetical protein